MQASNASAKQADGLLARRPPRLQAISVKQAAYAPNMKTSPCAKFTMRKMP